MCAVTDEPSAKEIEEAMIEVAAVERALNRPTIYDSLRNGPESIDSMNARHAQRAAKLVRRGERVGGPPVARALERHARQPGANKLRG